MARRYCLRLTVVALCSLTPCPSVCGQDADMADRINEAIDKGVKYLKKFPEDGNLVAKRPGSWALRAWALLEAGVPANDAKIKELVAYVRQEVPGMDKVYDLSISLILLDKLADPGDEPFIESLAVRLLGSQGTFGGWTYGVDMPNGLERARLANLLREVERLRAQGVLVKFRRRSPQEIARDVARQLATIQLSTLNFGGDNSNTQFAMIALWVARRHGVPVSRSLALVEKRYQISQMKSGAWGYDFPANGKFEDDNHYTYPAMTCAGLLGLALGQGVQPKSRDLRADNQVKAGFKVIAQALDKTPPENRPNYHYFLFSMERAAVVYNITKIGDFDWYLWGAEKLIATQANNGSWTGGFPYEAADTCFALLFLKRANVAHDLTDLLDAPIRKAPKK